MFELRIWGWGAIFHQDDDGRWICRKAYRCSHLSREVYGNKVAARSHNKQRKVFRTHAIDTLQGGAQLRAAAGIAGLIPSTSPKLPFCCQASDTR